YLTDNLGSVRYLADNTGARIATLTYDSFGKQLSTEDPDADRFRWTAREWDDGPQQYQIRAREYTPGTARFSQEDPADDDRSNPFRYVRNRPLTYRDPMGLSDRPVTIPNEVAGQFGLNPLTLLTEQQIHEKAKNYERNILAALNEAVKGEKALEIKNAIVSEAIHRAKGGQRSWVERIPDAIMGLRLNDTVNYSLVKEAVNAKPPELAAYHHMRLLEAERARTTSIVRDAPAQPATVAGPTVNSPAGGDRTEVLLQELQRVFGTAPTTDDVLEFVLGVGEGFVVDGFVGTLEGLWQLAKLSPVYLAGKAVPGMIRGGQAAASARVPWFLRPAVIQMGCAYGAFKELEPEFQGALQALDTLGTMALALAKIQNKQQREILELLLAAGESAIKKDSAPLRQKLAAMSSEAKAILEAVTDLAVELGISALNASPRNKGRVFGVILYEVTEAVLTAGAAKAAKAGKFAGFLNKLKSLGVSDEAIAKLDKTIKLLGGEKTLDKADEAVGASKAPITSGGRWRWGYNAVPDSEAAAAYRAIRESTTDVAAIGRYTG
ncbi:MAG: hypothetical protein L0312_05520, partial [Acidobacteria bacterium]|nr:hypothetical protein [Acidobacteriota bacterium]